MDCKRAFTVIQIERLLRPFRQKESDYTWTEKGHILNGTRHNYMYYY